MSTPVEFTSFDDCVRDLVRTSVAEREIKNWRVKPRIKKIVPIVENFVHRALYRITADEMNDVLERTEHALGDLEKAEVEMQEIEDLTLPALAVQDAFHILLERLEQVPTWDEFYEFLHEGDMRRLFLKEAWDNFKRENKRKYEAGKLKDALQWRLGRMYYSNLREIDAMVRMRVLDVHLKYHLLADVRLLADFWIGNHVVCIYLSNPRYRDRAEGRKERTQEKLGKANPEFRIHPLAIPNLRKRGKLYRVADDDLKQLAETIHGAPSV